MLDRHQRQLLFGTLHRLDEQQEQIMASLVDLQASLANLKTQLDALIAKHGVPAVSEADLDAVKTEIDADAAAAQQAANA